MKKDIYNTELEAMIDFWEELGETADYSCRTDGLVGNVMFEFKKHITNLKAHKEQMKRYIRLYNARALLLPLYVVLLGVNDKQYYYYEVYTNKDGEVFLYEKDEGKWSDVEFFKTILNKNPNVNPRGWIDESSIVAYNDKYCCIMRKKTLGKEKIYKEFTNPYTLNIYPFDWDTQINREEIDRETNNWLTFNMNMLGSKILKKKLGAYFTPDDYVKISNEYLSECIHRIQSDGYDYIIIDTCAGTGNLQKFWEKEWLSKTILNTYDYTEWLTLKILYDGKVKLIIPRDSNSKVQPGLLPDGDALSEKFNDYLMT